MFGVEKLRNNWFGRVFGLLGMSNLLLVLHWAYYNVTFLAWMRSTCTLILHWVQSLNDPVALLAAFDTWKDTVPILGTLLNKGTVYVEDVIQASIHGNLAVIVVVPLISCVILGFAISVYGIWNYKETLAFTNKSRLHDDGMVFVLLLGSIIMLVILAQLVFHRNLVPV